MKILNQDIKNRQFKPVYLLFGEEDFLKKSYKNRLRGHCRRRYHEFSSV